MNNYLLLRDNKESGPFNLNQLASLGLKKYDLVWVEGKSAAWRYPGEVEELKPYAPPVDEQPFDRFYKKEPVAVGNNICNTEAYNQQKSETVLARPKPRIRIKAEWNKVEVPAAVAAPVVAIAPAPAQAQPIKAPAKPVIENKQAGSNISINDNYIKQPAAPQPVSVKNPGWENSWLDWKQEKNAVEQASKKPETNTAPGSNVADSPVLETKFSQSLNDIKERYAATVLKAKNAAPEWHKSKKLAMVAVLAVPILCFGMWLGHKWTAPEQAGKVVYAKTIPDGKTQEPGIQQTPGEIKPADDGGAEATQPAKDAVKDNSKEMIPSFDNEDNNTPAVKQQPKQLLKRNAIVQKQQAKPLQQKHDITAARPVPPAQPANPKQQYVFAQPNNGSPGARNKTINPAILGNANNNPGRQAQPDPRDLVRKNNDNSNDDDEDNSPIYNHATHRQKMSDFVSVEADQPYTPTVQNLKLNVQNIADIPLDLVVIDVEYFDASNRFRNGQTVHIKHIPAGQSINVKVPDNANAAKIRYRVSLVSAEQKGVYLVADNR